MATAPPSFKIPGGQALTAVKLINTSNAGPGHTWGLMGPPIPGVNSLPASPSFSFLLEHSSGRKLVWDLGIRKDYLNHAPVIAEYIPTRGYDIQVTKNVIDILEDGGIKGEAIEAIIWR